METFLLKFSINLFETLQRDVKVTFCQVSFSSVVVIAGHVGGVQKLDAFHWKYSRPFFVIGLHRYVQNWKIVYAPYKIYLS